VISCQPTFITLSFNLSFTTQAFLWYKGNGSKKNKEWWYEKDKMDFSRRLSENRLITSKGTENIFRYTHV